jgi:hypothetical protein
MKIVFLFGNLKWWSYLNDSFALISSRYTIKKQNTNETQFINAIWHINLYMNIRNSNWHNWIYDTKWMKFLTISVLSRLLTSKHLKLVSAYLVVRNGEMWKTCISAPQNAKKIISWNIKSKCVTDFLLTVRSSSMKDYTCHDEVSI